MTRLHDGPVATWPAKARRLAEAAVAGLPVPPGVVLSFTDPPDASLLGVVRALVHDGPVIARAALAGEDEHDASAAGLGTSLANLHDLEAVLEARARIEAERRDPWLVRYRGLARDDDRVIVQRQVAARWLLAVAVPRDSGSAYAEVHERAIDPLARGTTPSFAGRLAAWPEGPRSAVEELVTAITERTSLGEHGLDLEIVVDDQGSPFLVQLRPLVQSLDPHWHAFREAVAAAGQLERMTGTLTLDAEHNPAPLSFAHAWLMGWLDQRRPNAGHPCILAGWLFVRTLPRALGGTPKRDQPSAVAAIHRLYGELLPRARARLETLRERLANPSREQLRAGLDEALAAFLAMIDAYLHELVPARSRVSTPERDAPLSLRDRTQFVDVLPTTWDIASPAMGDVSTFTPGAASDPSTITDEAVAATLLTESDDHLFALGLAPVRAVYLRAGALLGLGDEVFLLDGDELAAALEHDGWTPPALADRRRQYAAWAALRPPLRIEDGTPVPVRPHKRWRGLAIGNDHEGPIAQRRDLEHLLREPPPAHAIVVLPSLTAQTALALQSLSVRAVCCAYGGALSHAALMARELGLTALIGCEGCTELPDGTPARIDTRHGRLFAATAGATDDTPDP